jgi:hypothetical protein
MIFMIKLYADTVYQTVSYTEQTSQIKLYADTVYQTVSYTEQTSQIKLYADTVYQTVSSTEQTSQMLQITPSYCLSHTVPVESNVSYNKCVFKLDVV